ncbi:unnamed protein product [Anisakis simplex]|uniref:Polycystin-2 (inferred by orthology to a C. elegans protein) n=1 Tax=Anisakis simplex TaxID=6269 RepID=A0A0M3KB54_ANISI|nr:unnamed protein product [Anisakis simplex]
MATLQGSVYDTDALDIPPPITSPSVSPAALESEDFEDGKNKKNPQLGEVGKGNAFLNGIKGLWITRQGLDKDRVQLLKVTIRELITYIIFLTIVSIDVCFHYLQEPLLNALYWQGSRLADDAESSTGMLFEDSVLLGSPRIRMLKVNNHSCKVARSFKREIPECFGKYNEENDDKNSFGPANSSAFIYQTAEQLETASYWGAVATYGGGGFVQYLTISDRKQSAASISYLKQNRWINRATRAIFVDFVLYNANINLFCIAQFVLSLLQSVLMHTERQLRQVVPVPATQQYYSVNLSQLAELQENFNDALAVLLIFAWIKTMKYISFNKTMTQLTATLERSAKDIGGFSVMFFIFFLAYAQFGFLAFGTQIAEYSSLYNAVFALLRTILGDFDFDALENADRILGPLFFLTYVFFVFFILLNMFLAIINDSYTEVKSELSRQANDIEMADIAVGYWQGILKVFRLNKDDTTDVNDCDRFREALIAEGYNEDDITNAFVKFDITNRRLEFEEMQMVENELNAKRNNNASVLSSSAQNKNTRDISVLNYRINHIERSIFWICERIDILVNNIHNIDKNTTQNDLFINILRAEVFYHLCLSSWFINRNR